MRSVGSLEKKPSLLILWDLTGSQALSELHHDIASQCPKPSRDVDLTLAINKAERVSHGCLLPRCVCMADH